MGKKWSKPPPLLFLEPRIRIFDREGGGGSARIPVVQLLQARGAGLVGAGCHSVTKSLFFSENARILPPDLPSNLALSASFCDFGAHFCFVGVR